MVHVYTAGPGITPMRIMAPCDELHDNRTAQLGRSTVPRGEVHGSPHSSLG